MINKDLIWLSTLSVVVIWFVIAIIQFFVWSISGVELINVAHPVGFWTGSIVIGIISLIVLTEII